MRKLYIKIKTAWFVLRSKHVIVIRFSNKDHEDICYEYLKELSHDENNPLPYMRD